ncbi:SDR family NAD(P)-dependent oxidoreductase [Micromonospora sp. WMMD1120]|uniref:SDR family NAD(P)-dependent oxidoreductase n=1 Tax=Micromonospora sp. WMMD1120 TaxID=3016106 RepID=UPI0024180A5D|nr:SDR family NAD(P)-dependent oxidoreductase [Micromonospora sp. WMMD1120]MDG4809034.1 SDR family NAD(P)-dependent oxidoreductase [Micromonospora sp. WMMD1120]
MSRVVVVVGATSGIGRATARAFAARGDRLVLAARATDTLAEVRAECADTEVVTVPTDISEPEALDALAAAAIDSFGRIDVWVHTAAVMVYGSFEQVPERVFDQVVRTDLLSAASSVRVALRHFRAAGAGTVILTGSVLGHITAPYLSAYVASKWGLQGLARTVQQELRDSPGIRLCLVNPGSVDTPVYQQAANYLGRIGRPPPPVASARRVARAIVDCVDRPRREVSVGRLNVVMRVGFTALPGVYDVLVGPLMRLAGLSGKPVAAHDGSVFAPNPSGEAVSGGHLPDLRQLVSGPVNAVGAALRRGPGRLFGIVRN